MIKKQKYTNKNYISDLWHYIKPYKKIFFSAVLFRLTSDISRLYPAWAISRLVQILSDGSFSGYSRELFNIFIIWGILTIYYSFSHNFSKYLGYQVAEKASLDLYKETLAHIFKLDFAWQEKENSGNKMKRISRGQDGVDRSIRRVFNVMIEVVVNTIGIVALFSTLDTGLSIAIVFYIVSFFLVGTSMLKKAITQVKIVSKAYEDVEGFTFESLNNIHTIKSLAVDKGVQNIVEKKLADLYRKIKKRIYYFQTQFGLMNTYANLFRYGTILYLSIAVINGRTELSLLVLFIGLFDKVDSSAGELTEVVQELSKYKVWLNRAKDILRTSPKIEEPSKLKVQKKYDSEWKKLTVRNVTFSYKKNKALTNISFVVKRGQKVGIVGLSGAGKSTLFKLFLDLYENYLGEILLDDVPLKNMNRQTYIDHVAVVLQDTELFDMSLKENIEIASVKKIKQKGLIEKVIDMAHLRDVVDNLPKGLNTVVGEKGIKLSGGQRQRLGLARALYREPDILLLDEATSHLDTHSEHEIQRAILENVNKFTTIVIAHRLSTIKAMDNIIVLENGRVAEQGSFDDLIAKKGIFAKMWEDQKI